MRKQVALLTSLTIWLGGYAGEASAPPHELSAEPLAKTERSQPDHG